MRTVVSVTIALAFLFTLIFTGYSIYHTVFSVADITIQVTDKERVTKSTGDTVESYYLVFTTGEVFKNEDSIIHTKFNSSDIQGRLHLDSTYNVKVAGIRVPILSMYRNIIKINE